MPFKPLRERPITGAMIAGGIGRAERAAIGGIQRASSALESSAARITQQGTSAPSRAATVSISPEARARAQEAFHESRAREGDLAEALVDQSVAKHQNAANVRVLQAAEQVREDLGRINR
jgi:hypothetical protein